jgi:3-oxoacyl-[acyl-carrier protein] reductase
MKCLADKVIIITGAARGIGLQTVNHFLAAGAQVIAVDVDGSEELAQLQSASAVRFESVDVTNKHHVDSIISDIHAQHNKIDGLVHYAGITRDAMHWKMAVDDFEEVIRVNLLGTFIVSQAVSRIMRPQQFGSIVLTSSRVYLGNIGQANYAASKGAVVSLTRTLALELARSNVRVNALAPGFIETRMTARIPPALRERAVQATPLGRAGQPADVANAALFLISDAASFITGQVLFVDGGRTVGSSLA